MVSMSDSTHLNQRPDGFEVKAPVVIAIPAPLFVCVDARGHIRGRQQKLLQLMRERSEERVNYHLSVHCYYSSPPPPK